MDNPLISIIVPVYNAEHKVKKCVNSITSQTYSNIEIILINDGSTDNTEKVCRKLASKDERIILINQENGGVSKARNTGIENAKGEYIQFVDADDYIEPDMVQTLFESCAENEYTMVMCGFFREFSGADGKLVNKITIGNAVINDKKMFSQFFQELYNSAYINFPWNKLFLSDVIKNNNIKFDSTCSLGEDLVFNLTFIKHSCKILVINRALYHNVEENSNSLSRMFRADRQRNNVELYEYLLEYFKDNTNEDSIKEIHKMFLRSNYINLEHIYVNNPDISEEEKQKYIDEILNSEHTDEAIKHMKNTDMEGLYYKIFLSFKNEKIIRYSVILRHKLKNIIRKREKHNKE